MGERLAQARAPATVDLEVRPEEDRDVFGRDSHYIKHVRSARPLTIAVDGRTGRGVVKREE